MRFDLETALRFLQGVGPIVGALPAVKSVYDAFVNNLEPRDQAEAKEAYADLIADNDDGHRRLQDKLAAAARR